MARITYFFKKITNRQFILVLGIIILSAFLFKEALSGYFSHDDFFCFAISQPKNLSEIFNYFNLAKPYGDYEYYRPLTTQMFYLIGRTLLQMNPLYMHIVSFITFFITIYLVYKLSRLLFKDDKVALISGLLYGTSASNFTRLYYFGNYQQLGLGLFFFASLVSYVVFLKSGSFKRYVLSVVFFILALMSHETAVILPGILFIINIFILKKRSLSLIKPIVLFFIIGLVYLYLHTFFYGFKSGDSYIYDFSPRVFNTIVWYFNWSLNLPEMLIDYIGPSLKVNHNLFRFYGGEITPIIILYFFQLGILLFMLIKSRGRYIKLIFFCMGWFLIGLLTVVFLPFHKFSYYTTIAMFGLFGAISHIISSSRNVAIIFLILFIITSFLTKELTIKTSWITQGSQAAEKTKNTLDGLNLQNGSSVCFYDVEADNSLPWRPSQQLKIVLSDNNFFKVFYNNKITGFYTTCPSGDKVVKIPARDLLNY